MPAKYQYLEIPLRSNTQNNKMDISSRLSESEKRQIEERLLKDIASGEISKYIKKKGKTIPHIYKKDCEATIEKVSLEYMKLGLHAAGLPENLQLYNIKKR